MDYGTCRSCHAQIVWAKSAATGKPMPLNPSPDEERGNVLLDERSRAHVFRDAAAAIAHQDADPDAYIAASERWLSHHATCPNAARHRTREHDEDEKPVEVEDALGVLF